MIYWQLLYANEVLDAIANARWQHSFLRATLAYKHNTTSLHKRDSAMMAMGLAFTAPTVAGAVQGIKQGKTAMDKSNALFTGAFDVSSTLFMFSGSPPLVILGAGMMLAKTIFQDKPPPQLDPANLMQDISETVRMMIPTADQYFVGMKSFINEMMDNKMDIKFQEQYQLQIQRSLKVIALYLNNVSENQTFTKILDNYEQMVMAISKEMIQNKMPIDIQSDNLGQLFYYELGVTVAAYPQFISMMLLAIKEWYLLAVRLKQPTEQLELIKAKYYQYIKAFLYFYPKMINRWYDMWRSYMLTSSIKYSESGLCLLTLKIPTSMDIQQFIVEPTAEINYQFTNQTQREVTEITNTECRDANCKFIKLLTKNARQVCQYEKTYKSDCKKPCSKARQAFSWMMPAFGATKGECFKNQQKCKYTQTGLNVINSTCINSNCSIALVGLVNTQIEQLELNVKQVRQIATKFNSFLENSNIDDNKIIQQQLEHVDSIALQQVVKKDEIFIGDVCSGYLNIPANNGIKQCIVKTPQIYACPTVFNQQRQYILYPDIYRQQIGKLCPNYIKPHGNK